ncbi:RND family efflux transporter, MFP subunit [Kaistia soli DSM 19436]|uniref:RND family efflux transporter, MFP subunit n=1 Tax=Kaistia soli DSM 19436 TaxID=1122133 RepID=A0A1M5L6L9_9HYPH|nr:HlyD family secretion protein [Kaistia soli]SHG60063.1 RND family efflux transporter, MFP subunit [Kaistia soli DSM 19436]
MAEPSTSVLSTPSSLAAASSAPEPRPAPAEAPVAAESLPTAPPTNAASIEARRRSPVLHFVAKAATTLATLAVAAAAVVAVLMVWQYYATTPWTRNGVVRVQVANIAPQVSGEIIRLAVADNKFVRQGELLYEIDPFNFEVAARTAQAGVDQAAADVQVKQAQSDRRQRLSDAATTPEEQQVFAGGALQAKAAFDAATQQLAQARINMERTKVTSPVNGYVTNLLLRVGDFAAVGNSNISVVDAESFWIDGYFEETKLAQICIGDPVEAKLMGYGTPIKGHVETITRGISVGNAAAGAQGLPDVNPIYTWVQLAQRVPVRIAIDEVPPGVPLVSGLTATITVNPAPAGENPGWRQRLVAQWHDLANLFEPPAPRANCLGPAVAEASEVERLPVPATSPAPSPTEVDPGLVPGLDSSPSQN